MIHDQQASAGDLLNWSRLTVRFEVRCSSSPGVPRWESCAGGPTASDGARYRRGIVLDACVDHERERDRVFDRALTGVRLHRRGAVLHRSGGHHPGQGQCCRCPGETVGTTSGGAGATVSAILPVTPGATLYVEVGGPGRSGEGGFNGGAAGGATTVSGSPTGGGGGGASDVRTCSVTSATCNSLASRVLVAAAGGGAGLCGCAQGFGGGPGSFGGAGGNAGSPPLAGLPGSPDGCTQGGGGGGGATPTSGGPAGAGGGSSNTVGVAGQDAVGGAGGSPNAGRGGGGQFGGGGGGGGASFLDAHFVPHQGGGGGGGAGSSFIESTATNRTVGTATTGGQPSLSITAITPTPTPSLTLGANIAHRTVRESPNGRVTLVVDNPNSASASGKLTIRAMLARGVAATKSLVIGKAMFPAAAMASVKVRVVLTKKARAYLRKHGHLRARVTLVLSTGNLIKTTVQTIVIDAPLRRHS